MYWWLHKCTHKSQLLKLYTLNMCTLFYVNYTSELLKNYRDKDLSSIKKKVPSNNQNNRILEWKETLWVLLTT